ncbi:hypothetical protein [Teredinibacter purpureus]|uniref:hypothetical protein n=1 Tax=Teredinibacter purpureus TaxID=2731756 RepID=UPI0005F7A22D|nr:hypothetical protein [Teredinibacter purpureus]
MKQIEIRAWAVLIIGSVLLSLIVAATMAAPKLIVIFQTNWLNSHLEPYRDIIYNVAIITITTFWLKGQIKEFLLTQEIKSIRKGS